MCIYHITSILACSVAEEKILCDSMCHLYSLRACKSFNVILIKGNFSTAVTAAKSPVRHISPSGLLALLHRCQWNYPTREFRQAIAVKLVFYFFPDSLLLLIFDLEKISVRKSGTIKYDLPSTNEICFKITTKRQKRRNSCLPFLQHPIFVHCSLMYSLPACIKIR